jgi:deoxyribodipyrimidine photo-lyase
VYVFDPRQFGLTRYGFPKTGCYRVQFLLESVADLQVKLRALGSDLILRNGSPEQIIPELVQRHGVSTVHATAEATSEETTVERAVEAAIRPLGATLKRHWTATLYHLDDLPFANLRDMPEIFSEFRRAVERRSSIRQPIPAPRRMPPLPATAGGGRLPDHRELNSEPPPRDPRAAIRFAGGETAALNRVREYIWKRDRLRSYKETRNGLLGEDYSSKFSPWLANGCLSPRRLYAEIRDYERRVVANDSTYWLIFELIWRDFFRFIALKHGNALFKSGGLRRKGREGREDRVLLTIWARGETGYPFVDANMIELARTGWMSNRGRQNVASFLVRDMKVHWRMGAEFFESLLIDYDPCSNWGNWNYVAGVGNDPREDRYFAVLKQAANYDPNGDFVRHWIPELAQITGGDVHAPWRLGEAELRRAGVRLGDDYPKRVVALAEAPSRR